jgi:NAD+ synthase
MTTISEPSAVHTSPINLKLDAAREVERLTEFLRKGIRSVLRRRGAVVGCSGGIDSSVVLALCARALGAGHVAAVLMPERESSPESAVLARDLAAQLGVTVIEEDLTEALEHAGCYARRDEAIRRVCPEFGPQWKSKISLPGNLLEAGTLNVFYLTAISPGGQEQRLRLPPAEFAQIVAASNWKQRLRMATLYYQAELRGYAVAGTDQKNEHDLGFFVKYGDGGVDISPIRHLFKSQVYQLAQCLDIPRAIQDRTPSTDTYSAGSTQEEFFYRLPFHLLDTIWCGYESGASCVEMAAGLGLQPEQVRRVIADLESKKRATEYLRAMPLVIQE